MHQQNTNYRLGQVRLHGGAARQGGRERLPDGGHPERDGHQPLVAAARQLRQLGQGTPVLQGAHQPLPLPQV